MLVRIKGIKRYRVRKKDGRIYDYAYHRATGKRIESAIGTPEFLAEIARLNIAADVLQPRDGSLSGLIFAYRKSPEFNGLAPRSRADYDKVFDWLQPIGDMAVCEIDGPFLIALRDQAYAPRKQKKHEKRIPGQRRRFANYVVQVMSLLFAWGRPRGFVESNVADGIPRIKRGRDEKKRNRPWGDAELATVLERAPKHIRLMVALGVYAGMREQTAIVVPWSAYDGSTLRFDTAKRGVHVIIPATAKLRAILDEAPRKSPLIALNSRGRAWTESGFRASFTTMRNGLLKEGLIAPGLTFHGLRHTVGKALAEVGCDARTIAAVLGHRSEAAARLYADAEDRTKRAAGAIRKFERRK